MDTSTDASAPSEDVPPEEDSEESESFELGAVGCFEGDELSRIKYVER
jgi:hypothetical protein